MLGMSGFEDKYSKKSINFLPSNPLSDCLFRKYSRKSSSVLTNSLNLFIISISSTLHSYSLLELNAAKARGSRVGSTLDDDDRVLLLDCPVGVAGSSRDDGRMLASRDFAKF